MSQQCGHQTYKGLGAYVALRAAFLAVFLEQIFRGLRTSVAAFAAFAQQGDRTGSIPNLRRRAVRMTSTVLSKAGLNRRLFHGALRDHKHLGCRDTSEFGTTR